LGAEAESVSDPKIRQKYSAGALTERFIQLETIEIERDVCGGKGKANLHIHSKPRAAGL
jgi:hypothetical protein